MSLREIERELETEVGWKKVLEVMGGESFGVFRREKEMVCEPLLFFPVLQERACCQLPPISGILTSGWQTTRTAVVRISPMTRL